MEAPEHRFETSKTFDGPAGNNYTELTAFREKERLDAIKKGLIDDPTKPKALEDARVFRGTCLDMCPLYEREQREFQNDVKRWEINPKTNRIDKDLAVKAFHRPAAGNEQALPSDVRPPEVLSRTLDYLVQKIVSDSDPLDKDTHGFVRDRTRSIRQDFTLQNERGSVAIACHERIVRFHILSLHQMCGIDGFDAHQEMEQLRKTLQSLAEYYDDQRHGERTYEHEAEFRAYHIMTRLRDPDVLRHVQTLPKHIRKDPSVAHALRLYKYAQRSNEEVGRFKAPNSEGSYNGYTRFFQLVRSAHTSYAMACLCETQFNSVRKGALKSMRKAFIAAVKAPSVDELVTMLGCDDSEEVELQCEQYGVIVRPDEDGVKRIILNKSSQFDESRPELRQRFSETLVEFKRGALSFADVIDGKIYTKDSTPGQDLAIQKQNEIVDNSEGTKLKLSKVSAGLHDAKSTPVQPVPAKFTQKRGLFPVSQVPLLSTPSSVPIPRFDYQNTVGDSKSGTALDTQTKSSPTSEDVRQRPVVGGAIVDTKGRNKTTVNIEKASKDAARDAEESRIIEELSQDLYINLVRNQIHRLACETYAEYWRELHDRRTAWTRIKTACLSTQRRRTEAHERAISEATRQADYESAFRSLHMKSRSTVSRKRGRSLSNIGASASSEIVRQAQDVAQRFWAPLNLEQLLGGIEIADKLTGWNLFVALTGASSTHWLKTKFGMTSNNRSLLIRDREFRVAFDTTALSTQDLRGVGALIFQISSDLEKDRESFLSLVQRIADECDRSFPILLLAFEPINEAQISSNLLLTQILSDRKSPVTYCGMASVQTMNDITKFDEQLKEMLTHTSTRISPLGLERAALREQQERINQLPAVSTASETRTSKLRNSFYDTEVMRVTPMKPHTLTPQKDIVPRQLSNLQDSVRKARELLARAAT